MRITESKLRKIIRSIIKEEQGQQTKFYLDNSVVLDHIAEYMEEKSSNFLPSGINVLDDLRENHQDASDQFIDECVKSCKESNAMIEDMTFEDVSECCDSVLAELESQCDRTRETIDQVLLRRRR